ncbi:putative ABC transporter ATP-binding protein, partial [Haemophilus influenzae]
FFNSTCSRIQRYTSSKFTICKCG